MPVPTDVVDVTHTVIVGASLAGLRAAEGLRRRGYHGAITIIGEEDHLPYDRPPLSKQYLTGKTDAAGTALALPDDLDVTWKLGTRAVELDLAARAVRTTPASTSDQTSASESASATDQEWWPFDQLVIATGAHARRWPSATPEGVHVLRTLDDAEALSASLVEGARVVIVGAGFIGLEVAASCRHRGLDVTVIEPLDAPVVRAVGPVIGAWLAELHRSRGVELRLSTAVEGFVGDDHVEAVRLADGTLVPADVVVVGIGAVPTTDWLGTSGVDLDNGVVCNERLQVLAGGQPVPGVVAAGDVTRWWHTGWAESARIEHWTNAADQGDMAAATLLDGDAAPAFAPLPYVWSDQYERKLQVLGHIRGDDDMVVLEENAEETRLLAAFGRNGRLVGAVGVGRPAKVMALGRRITAGEPFPPAD